MLFIENKIKKKSMYFFIGLSLLGENLNRSFCVNNDKQRFNVDVI